MSTSSGVRAPKPSDQTVVITGANRGIGYEAARAFAAEDATVVMACRSIARGEAAKEEILAETPTASISVLELDLADLDVISAFAETFQNRHDELHCLCNNAAVQLVPYQQTTDGFEMHLGVNHLGHFALTALLFETLVQTDGEARVVTMSSGLHERGEIEPDKIGTYDEESYNRWTAYARSKLANLLFAFELDRRLSQTDYAVKSVAAHPGYADTSRNVVAANYDGSKVLQLLLEVATTIADRVFAQSAEHGAEPLLYAATAGPINGGEYIGPSRFGGMRGPPGPAEPAGRARDRETAKQLWETSEELTGVTFEPHKREAAQ